MLFYAFKPGTTADTFVDALAERAAAGLESRSPSTPSAARSNSTKAVASHEPAFEPRAPRVVSNDGILIAQRRQGSSATGMIESHASDALHFDHRKMIVIDGSDR